jgi:hypothetical protein|tara:strand:+ start:197 stop:586 length:390 start_codon:yes stop_codon:yes gene_type:complete
VNIGLDAVHEGVGLVESIAKGKGLRKIGMGIVIRMSGKNQGGRLFKITKGGLTEAMLNDLPKVGSSITYKYCEMNEDGLPTFPALKDDYMEKRNLGNMVLKKEVIGNRWKMLNGKTNSGNKAIRRFGRR